MRMEQKNTASTHFCVCGKEWHEFICVLGVFLCACISSDCGENENTLFENFALSRILDPKNISTELCILFFMEVMKLLVWVCLWLCGCACDCMDVHVTVWVCMWLYVSVCVCVFLSFTVVITYQYSL